MNTGQASKVDGPVSPTVPVRYLRELLMYSGLERAQVSGFLVAAGLSVDVLELPGFRVNLHQFESVYFAARRACRDEMFGYFTRPVPPGAYATVLRLLSRCATIETCIESWCDFYHLFEPRPLWSLSVHEGRTRLRVSPRSAEQSGSAAFVTASLAIPLRTFGWLAGRAIPLDEVALLRGLPGLTPSNAQFLFSCKVRFGEDLEATFPAEFLRLPVVRRPTDASEQARRSIRALLAPATLTSLASRVRALLADQPPASFPSVEVVARALRTSRPTLARRLREGGTSFQQIRDELLRDRAVALLSSTSRSVAEIAEELGYSESSAFQRAFKGWTGVTPGKYRGETSTPPGAGSSR